jgi:hypothetical protein
MKLLVSCFLAALFIGCATKSGPVTPKPDIGRVITANERTQGAIKKTKTRQKELGDSQIKVEGSLKSVMDDLNQLLGVPK